MNDEKDESLIAHIEALRSTLLQSIAALALCTPFGFYFARPFIDFLIKWSMPEKIAKLNFFSPMEVFIVELKIGLILALSFAFPYILNRIWNFLKPALYKNERKFIIFAIFTSSLLFLIGTAFCVAFVLPLVMKFAAQFVTPQMQAMIGLSQFINLAGAMMLAFGIMFQFPLFIMLLVKFDIVSVETLADKRPFVVIIILVIAAILTPPDIVSQLMLGVPTYMLFELGLLGARIFCKNHV